MIGATEKQNVYLSAFESRIQGCEPWILPFRKAAIERFAELGFPTTRMEDWKYTSVAALAKVPFRLASTAGNLVDGFGGTPLAGLDSTRLVFVNGRFNPQLSAPLSSHSVDGVKHGSIAEAVSARSSTLEANLSRLADYSQHAFVALNTAFLEDGAFVEIPSGVALQKPIHLLFITEEAAAPAVTHPRVLIVAGHNIEATIVEEYVGPDEQAYFTNAVTEIVLGDNSIIDHVKLQREGDRSFHFATVQVNQHRSSNFYSHSISLGAELVRNDINVVLNGDGAECTLDGLYVENGNQHVDNHTLIDHATSHCNSRELYKGILDGSSAGVFNGSIMVRKDAQKTDARQTNKNLLLSEKAEINTKPQLEIYADDVKCSHGATIGQMDQEAIFYLRSRGIPYEEARGLLTYAFSNEIMLRIKNEEIRAQLEKAVFSKFAGM